MTNSVSINY